MKELFKSSPLILFLGLLLILSISIYFGNRTMIISEALTNKDAAYIMNSKELECYKNNNPDLKNMNPTQLQEHWLKHGANEKRNNQCPPTPAPTTAKPTTKPPTPAPTTAKPTAAKSTLDPKMANDIRTILAFMKESTSPSLSSSTCENSKSGGSSSTDSDAWFKYWEHVAKSNDPSKFSSSNMIPKTQVVPPICPHCATSATSATSTTAPSSCSGGACTSCGGFGGNGTTMSYKNRFSDFLAKYGSGYQGEGKWAGYGGNRSNETSNETSKDTSKDTKTSSEEKSKTTDEHSLAKFARDAGSGAKDLLEDTGSGAKDLLEDTGSGATGLLRDSASGATGLLRDTASGATGLLRETGSGVAGLLKSSPMQLENRQQGGQSSSGQQGGQIQGSQGYNNPYQTGYYSQGVYNLPNNPLGIQGIDPYSYNGALVSKGSNYIPVTSDFSSFRK